MKKAVGCFFILSIISLTASAQKQGNIWYFGDGAGLDFNSGTPVAITDGQINLGSATHNEGTAVISDSLGALLFYSNGEKVWNGNHQIMPNGDSLMGHASSTQAALIVPQPTNTTSYYVFTTDAFYQSNLKNGLRYSIVDMCLDNESGDIIVGSKNTLLLDTVAEKLTACKHSNGIDYWIVTHKYWSNEFYAFLLTANGIEDTVISNIGSIHMDINNPTSTAAAIGQMKISPDGTKIALVFSNTVPTVIELFDFDNSTGSISNNISLPSEDGEYGISFSPDNSKLYISTVWFGTIYQYDLLASGGNPDSIIASKTLIAQLGTGLCCVVEGLQLGPDGKIYVAREGKDFLAVINNPNTGGTACNFIDAAVDLNGMVCYLSLPGFVDSYNYPNTNIDCSTGLNEIQKENTITIYPNPFIERTTFAYTLDDPGQVELIIHTYTGQYVTTLVSEQQRKGSYEIDWNTSDIAPGIYFYTLKVDGVEWVKKAVKIK